MQFPTRYKSAAKCAGQVRGRYAMHFLRLEGTDLVATDGRRIVALPVTLDEHDVDGYVTQDALLAACRAKSPARSGEAVLLANGDLRAPLASFLATRPDKLDGEFPNWRACVPTIKAGDEGTVSVTLDADLLAGIADCLTSNGHNGVTLTFRVGLSESNGVTKRCNLTRCDLSPILVQNEGLPGSGYGVLMPMSVRP